MRSSPVMSAILVTPLAAAIGRASCRVSSCGLHPFGEKRVPFARASYTQRNCVQRNQ